MDDGGGDVADALLMRAGVPWVERLRNVADTHPADSASPASSDPAAFPDDLDSWRREVDPGDLGGFARRLRLGGLTVEDALAVVHDRDPSASTSPDWWPWLVRFRRAYGPGADPAVTDLGLSDLDWLARREAEMPEGVALSVPFSALLWPAVLQAWADLAEEHPDLVGTLAGTASTDLRRALLTRLSWVASPCLIAALDEGVTFGQRLLRQMGPVPDDPPRDRYARLCREEDRTAWASILRTRPVLASLLAITLRQWHTATVELLARVAEDRAALADVFAIDPGTAVTSVAWGAGDTHQDGRSVAMLHFGETCLVYKPRDIRLEAFWGALVESLSSRLPGLRAPRILARGDQHGYAEFIAHQPAADDGELTAFYRNAGATMALLLALSATDCHFENLIAHGEHLVLIDGEALFETSMGSRLPESGTEPPTGVDSATVLQLGMLPTWLWLEGRREAYDITALGARPTPAGTMRALRALNTDVMAWGEVPRGAEHPTSLPTPDGQAPDLSAHVDALVEGFECAYRAIIAERDTAVDAVLSTAAGLRRRLIARATYVYASLLQSSLAPEALTSGAARGMVLERLTRAYLAPEEEALWPRLMAEQKALGRLDVPLFEADLGGGVSRWLGGELVDGPERDALADVRARLAQWDEVDLARQVQVIRASVRARGYRMSTRGVREQTMPAGARVSSAHDAARSCLARIRRDALPGVHETTWMGLSMLPDGERVNVQVLGPGLYDGRVGLAVFCFAAGAPDLAHAAIDPVLDALDGRDAATTRRVIVGGGLGISGTGGYLRVLDVLAERGHLDDERAQRLERSIVRALSDEYVARDVPLDLIGGAAGLIAPLARLLAGDRLDSSERARVRDLLRTAADRLVERQLDGGGWRTLPGSAPLTGLAHGASGVAVALVEAALALDDPGYLDAALRGLSYEAACFDPGAGNWPDYRDTAAGGFMLGWCAGAPGIALARARLLQLLPTHDQAAEWRDQLEAAATTTANAPLLARDHLCCGNLGRVAILRSIARGTGEPTWDTAASRIAAEVLADAPDGLPRSILGSSTGELSVPGLMTGLAGAGLVLADDDPSWWVSALLV